MSKHYDPEADSREVYAQHYVFNPSVKVKFPDSNESARASMLIMPAFPHEEIPGWDVPKNQQYSPYRRYDLPMSEGKKSHSPSLWIRHYFVYEWVGGKVNVISPKSYWDEKISGGQNPIGVLYDYLKSNVGRYGHLIGLNPDGKKPKEEDRRQELFRSKILGPHSRKFVLNASLINNKGELEPVSLFSLPDGAVLNRGSRDDAGSAWGLFDELNRPARGVDPARLAENPSSAYYWGDVTDPRAAITIDVYRQAPPTGGSVKLYNSKPVDSAPRIVSAEMLAARVHLADDAALFAPYDTVQVVKLLVSTLGDKYPDILVSALSGGYPIKHMLDAYLVKGEDNNEDDDHIPMVHPAPAATTVAARSYAPAPSQPPVAAAQPPATGPEFWVSLNGTVVLHHFAQVEEYAKSEGASNLQIMPKDQSSSWGTAASFGFKDRVQAPVPPPAPVAPVAPVPPSAPVAPAPPPASLPPVMSAATPVAPPAVYNQPQAIASPVAFSPPPMTTLPPPPSGASSQVTVDMLRNQLYASDVAPVAQPAPPPWVG